VLAGANRSGSDLAADATRIKQRDAQLATAKTPHESTWASCYRMTFPSRGSGLQQSEILSASDVQQQKARIFDSTAGDSVKVGVASTMGGMVPSNALWFGLDVGDESDEERLFLDVAAKFMWENIHASNFDAEAYDAMIDEFVAGWFVLYLDEKPEGGYYFEAWPIGECKIASTRSGSMIDTVYRRFRFSVSQAVATYGIDKVSPAVAQKFHAQKFDDPVEIIHSIEPREIYVVGAKLAKNMKFASCHVEVESGTLLKESGYEEFPCMCPRWMRLPGSAYATGPMSDALPDVLTLNEMVKWTLMGAETTIAPMLAVVDDGTINVRNVKIGPRKVLVVGDINNVKPITTGADIKAGMLSAESLQGKIRKILLADQLPPADGPVKTAYEWSVRVQALRAMLGPMFGRFQAEFLQAMIERAFGLMWRANVRSGFKLIGKPPQSLLERNFSIRYLSPLARSQKLADVDAMDRYEATLAQEAAIDPSVLDVYDLEEAARQRGTLLGVPSKLIRDKKATGEARANRMEGQAQAQQAALLTQGKSELISAGAQRVAKAA